MKLQIKLAIVSAVFVVALTALTWRVFSPWLFYSLYPGLAVSLLITGGHGGTHMQDFIGNILGVMINILVYFLVLLLVSKFLIRRKES